jgi:hypothetical protein
MRPRQLGCGDFKVSHYHVSTLVAGFRVQEHGGQQG